MIWLVTDVNIPSPSSNGPISLLVEKSDVDIVSAGLTPGWRQTSSRPAPGLARPAFLLACLARRGGPWQRVRAQYWPDFRHRVRRPPLVLSSWEPTVGGRVRTQRHLHGHHWLSSSSYGVVPRVFRRHEARQDGGGGWQSELNPKRNFTKWIVFQLSRCVKLP